MKKNIKLEGPLLESVENSINSVVNLDTGGICFYKERFAIVPLDLFMDWIAHNDKFGVEWDKTNLELIKTVRYLRCKNKKAIELLSEKGGE